MHRCVPKGNLDINKKESTWIDWRPPFTSRGKFRFSDPAIMQLNGLNNRNCMMTSAISASAQPVRKGAGTIGYVSTSPSSSSSVIYLFFWQNMGTCPVKDWERATSARSSYSAGTSWEQEQSRSSVWLFRLRLAISCVFSRFGAGVYFLLVFFGGPRKNVPESPERLRRRN